MCSKVIIEIGLCVVMVCSVITTIVSAFQDRIISARVIQFVSVSFLVPVIAILGIENVIDGQVIGALLGAIAGYILSKVGEYTKESSSKINQ